MITTEKNLVTRGIGGNELKLLAAVLMLIDHLGSFVFTDITLLRIIGRLSFPIFAYFIYVGCRHTRSLPRYFLRVFLLGVLCVAVYYFAFGRVYLNILITFSLSICLVGLIRYAKSLNRILGCALVLTAFCAVFELCRVLSFDYGFFGIAAAPLAEIFGLLDERMPKSPVKPHSVGFVLAIVAVAADMGGIQVYSLLAFVFLALYNGEKGINLGRYFFYVFYPLQFIIVAVVSILVRIL